MSEAGQSRHHEGLPTTSGLPPKTVVIAAGRDVSKVPILLQKSVEDFREQ